MAALASDGLLVKNKKAYLVELPSGQHMLVGNVKLKSSGTRLRAGRSSSYLSASAKRERVVYKPHNFLASSVQ